MDNLKEFLSQPDIAKAPYSHNGVSFSYSQPEHPLLKLQTDGCKEFLLLNYNNIKAGVKNDIDRLAKELSGFAEVHIRDHQRWHDSECNHLSPEEVFKKIEKEAEEQADEQKTPR